MSDLRPEDRLISNKTDGLAEYIVDLVGRWENSRDVDHRNRWEEYERMWRGEWNAQDRDRQSERSKAIMPAIAQAVDSAVSEVEEAMFGQERWFDVDSDIPGTPTDEGGPGRDLADQMLTDLRNVKAGISEAVLLGAIYGTGICKVIIKESSLDTIELEAFPILPLEFVIDPASKTIEEAHGVAHIFNMPYSAVLERQRQGIYAQIDPQVGVEPADRRHYDSDYVRIIEYQGLVPSRMLPDVADDRTKLQFEEDKPVEAIITVANDNVVLRAQQNPVDRGFVAFQWDTDPKKFWGRGIIEKGYWPQKVLDSEVRARIDALAFSVHPMMAVNATMVPRGKDFSVRPGRNIFLNGPPSEALQPISFPPPDPQTYTQGQEMQRMIEMATGQLQAATPFGTNGRNETASGMSMMLGGSIRRTRRTMANIERSFLKPLIRKMYDRYQAFDSRYQPMDVEFTVLGTLGMMAREYESMQLTQLLNALPPGPAQFMLLRSVVENMSLKGKQDIMQLLDLLTAQSLQPQEPPPDLGGQARVMSAQTRDKEVEYEREFNAAKLQLEQTKLQIAAMDKQRIHERGIMQLSVDAERAEAEDTQKTSQAILNLAKAEAEELGQQLEQYRRAVSEMPVSGQTNDGQSIDLSKIQEELESLRMRVESTPNEDGGLAADDIKPIVIERNAEGLVTNINGRSVQRDQNGLIIGVS